MGEQRDIYTRQAQLDSSDTSSHKICRILLQEMVSSSRELKSRVKKLAMGLQPARGRDTDRDTHMAFLPLYHLPLRCYSG